MSTNEFALFDMDALDNAETVRAREATDGAATTSDGGLSLSQPEEAAAARSESPPIAPVTPAISVSTLQSLDPNRLSLTPLMRQ